MSCWSVARLDPRCVLLAASLASGVLQAQKDVTCVPVSERAGREFGCYITARTELGALPKEPALFWHLDTYPSVTAATAAAGARGTVVESLGRIWLFSIADSAYRPSGGTRVTRIGPLPLIDAAQFAAVYMEGVFQPGMTSVVHRHPGVEAFYTLEGSMCLETPEGRMDQRAGDAGITAAPGVPMVLLGTGTVPRRSVVLILQDATQPRSVPAHDWVPKGLCSGAAP